MEWNSIPFHFSRGPISGAPEIEFLFLGRCWLYIWLCSWIFKFPPAMAPKIDIASFHRVVNVLTDHFEIQGPAKFEAMRCEIEALRSEKAGLEKENEELRKNQNVDQKFMAGWAGAEGRKIEASAKADEEASAKADEAQVLKKILYLFWLVKKT